VVGRSVILLLWAMPALTAVRAQHYGFTQYTPKEGLAQSQVRSIAQDVEGRLWVGTLGGVSRFDGHDFRNYALQEGLPEAQVNAVLSAQDGTVWLGAGGSLVAFRGERVQVLPLPAEARGARILCLAETASGELLIGTDGAGLYRLESDGPEPVPGFPSDSASTVRALLPLPHGPVIAGTRTGAYRINGVFCEPMPLGEGDESVGALALDPSGTLWFGTFGDGLFGLKPDGTLLQYDESTGLLQNNVRDLLVDANGRLWVASKFGLNLIDGDRVRAYTVHQGMPNDNVWCLFQDAERGIWIGTDGAGVLRYAGERFVTWTAGDGLCSDLVMAIVADHAGDLWLGTYGNGVCRMDGMAQLSTLEGLPNNTVWCALATPDSSLWFGTTDGLVCVRQGRLVPLDSARALRGTRVLALHRDPDGSLWCGTREGVAVLSPGGAVQWPGRGQGAALRSVRGIAHVGDDHWLATDQGLVRVGSKGTERWTTAQGLCDNTVQCVVADGAGRVWAGTTNGLACIAPGGSPAIIRLGADFGSNYVDLLLADADGRLWAGTNNGLYRFHPDSLLLGAGVTDHFTAVDGLRGLEFNLNAGFRDRRGRLLFGTNAGLVMHDPAQGPAALHRPPPSPRIVGLRAFMLPTDWKGQCDSLDTATGLPIGLDLVYRKNHLTFDYTAVELADPASVRFQYRLSGFDPDWLPPTEARFASYSNLPHGRYRFEVRASRDGLNWGPASAFDLRIAPPFWIRWWFFALCAGAAALIAYGVMRFRAVRRQRQEKTRQLLLRSRMLQLEQQALNANMNRHFIFNALNSIQFYINRQDRTAANKYLTSFAKLIRKNLDASRNDTTSLAEELERLELYLVLEHMRFKDKFRYELVVDPVVDTRAIELPAMMLQPYVENSIWHGILPMDRPGTVSVRVGPGAPGHVRIMVVDDGIGVETSRERKSGRPVDHISRGIEITKGRADVLRRLELADIRIQGPDQLNDEQGRPCGTGVTIELPSKLGESDGHGHLRGPSDRRTFEPS
jgi:ligand-binding sensor domain-containing protein